MVVTSFAQEEQNFSLGDLSVEERHSFAVPLESCVPDAVGGVFGPTQTEDRNE